MGGSDFQFRLFVADDEPNSHLAEHNLRTLCNAHLPGRHRIEVIDVLVDFEAALHAHIMVAPTLLMVSPRPVTLFGALTDEPTVLAALGLNGADHRT
ncbi:MAG: circadian clock protein KaiB [Sulfuritalea sp.]|nr:circadian clock protein KaiB [Sulfuritalea sp.]MBK8120051.1 circadian clock protein KaiB [Sulfuritalea sp.]